MAGFEVITEVTVPERDMDRDISQLLADWTHARQLDPEQVTLVCAETIKPA